MAQKTQLRGMASTTFLTNFGTAQVFSTMNEKECSGKQY